MDVIEVLKKAKLDADWTVEEILREINNWCTGKQYKWEPELGHLSKSKLIKLFMSVDGYGGTFRGRELYYTYRKPLYVLNEYKVLEYFTNKQPKRYEADISNSERLTEEQRARRIRRQEAVKAGRSGKAYNPGTIKTAAGIGRPSSNRKAKHSAAHKTNMPDPNTIRTNNLKHTSRTQNKANFDADVAAALLAKKFGDRVQRFK